MFLFRTLAYWNPSNPEIVVTELFRGLNVQYKKNAKILESW